MTIRRMTIRRMLLRAAAALLAAGGALAAPAGGAPAACPPAVVLPDAAQQAAAARQDRGLLWRAERDGRVSYLYGTLHVGKPEWMQPGPAVRAALDASDVIALEIDPADPAIGAAFGVGPDTPVLPARLRARLERQVAASCLPEGALAALHPALQAVLLALLEARWAGLDPGYAQEQALAEQARATSRPLVALETVALQRQVLVPDSEAALHGMIDSTLEQLESGRGRSVIARLARAWEQGDLATLEDYERWCDCSRTDDERAALRALNDARNPGLAARIDALHRDGKRVFAAVGALHMTGAAALPRLLAARGFTVRRLAAAR
jgi:uncharacterized protein